MKSKYHVILQRKFGVKNLFIFSFFTKYIVKFSKVKLYGLKLVH